MHPYLLHSGHLLLPTFGVLAAVGLMAALTLSLRTAAIVGLDPDKLWNAGLFTLLSAFALSRLLLIIANPHSFLAYPILLLMVPSLNAAGILLTVIATAIYLRLRHLPLLDTLDAWAPCATLTWAFLALGHFAEGTDAGLPTTLPWGMAIPPAPPASTPSLSTPQSPQRSSPSSSSANSPTASTPATPSPSPSPPPAPRNSSSPSSANPTPTPGLLDPIQWIALGMIALAGLILLLQPRKLVTHAV